MFQNSALKKFKSLFYLPRMALKNQPPMPKKKTLLFFIYVEYHNSIQDIYFLTPFLLMFWAIKICCIYCVFWICFLPKYLHIIPPKLGFCGREPYDDWLGSPILSSDGFIYCPRSSLKYSKSPYLSPLEPNTRQNWRNVLIWSLLMSRRKQSQE